MAPYIESSSLIPGPVLKNFSLMLRTDTAFMTSSQMFTRKSASTRIWKSVPSMAEYV